MLDEGQSLVGLIGIYLILGIALIGVIYWGVRSGGFRKYVEGLKETSNALKTDFKGESWTGKIIMGLGIVIAFVGLLAFQLWAD